MNEIEFIKKYPELEKLKDEIKTNVIQFAENLESYKVGDKKLIRGITIDVEMHDMSIYWNVLQ